MNATLPIRAITLRMLLAEYTTVRQFKETTYKNYHQRVHGYLADWLDMPVVDITNNMTKKRHMEISCARGGAIANATMRTLRALLNYAARHYQLSDGGLLVGNPVTYITWNLEEPRRDVLTTFQLKKWFQAVYSLDNTTFRDLLITMLLSGMRKGEALSLRWEQVNLNEGTITIKNNAIDLVIPMSDFLWDLVRDRFSVRRSEYVFGSNVRNAPICAATKYIDLVIKASGVKFSLHTLRRTFIACAVYCDVPQVSLRNLLNSAHNERASVQRLRKSTNEITGYFLARANMNG